MSRYDLQTEIHKTTQGQGQRGCEWPASIEIAYYTAAIPSPHNTPSTIPIRPAEAQFIDLIAAAVDDEDEAAAEAFVAGDDIAIDVVAPAP